jgi:hypothetical protein
MSYGTLPSFDEFSRAIVEECAIPHEIVWSKDDARTLDECDITAPEGEYGTVGLYDLLEDLTEAYASGVDEAGAIAARLLATFGFEWK